MSQSTPTRGSTSWQPSTLDQSSPTYSGSLSGYGHSTSSPIDIPGGRRARVLIGVLVLIVGSAYLAWRFTERAVPAALGTVAVIDIVEGAVSASSTAPSTGRVASWSPSLGQALVADTVIDTSRNLQRSALDRMTQVGSDGSGGAVALRLTDGSSVRLAKDSRLRLASASSLVLERGTVYVDHPNPASATSRGSYSGVEVRTALGVVRDIGTQFEVRIDEDARALRIRVREGEIELQPLSSAQAAAGPVHSATAGIELELRSDGSLDRRTTAIHGARWDWVLDLTPMPDLDGMSLLDFLVWMRRETGLELSFEDPESRAVAQGIILHGDADRLSPSEALDMVFDGSELSYRMVGGELVVTGSPAPTAASESAPSAE